MFGCIRKLGCLVLILVGVVAYLTRGYWLHYVKATDAPAAKTTLGPPAGWQPVTHAGAERAKAAVLSLEQRSGPVFTNLSPGDLASYVFLELARQLPSSADSIEARADDGTLCIRASVKLSELGGTAALGPLGGFLGDRERLLLCGGFAVMKPGVASFTVTRLQLRDFVVPAALIPKLVQRLRRGDTPAGLGPNALALPIPSYLADVRVTPGRVTLYKNVP